MSYFILLPIANRYLMYSVSLLILFTSILVLLMTSYDRFEISEISEFVVESSLFASNLSSIRTTPNSSSIHSIDKRFIHGNICNVLGLVDHSFVRKNGHRRAHSIALIEHIFNQSNEAFISANFSVNDYRYRQSFDKYGSSLFQIEFGDYGALFRNGSDGDDIDKWFVDEEHFLNRKNINLLDELKQKSSDYCLVLLLTDQLMVNRVTGQEYNGFSLGRICDMSGHNLAVVSFHYCESATEMNCVRNVIHELGHAFGAIHDLYGMSSSGGGDYVMRQPFESSIGVNNLKLSPIAIEDISATIEEIGHQCFTHDITWCGNHKVEIGEQCDEGPEPGPCCTSDCKLRPKAICSPFNALCCSDQCQVSPLGQACLHSDSRYCLAEAQCNGIDVHCPVQRAIHNGAACSIVEPNGTGICITGHCYRVAQSDRKKYFTKNDELDSFCFSRRDIRGFCNSRPSPQVKELGKGEVMHLKWSSWFSIYYPPS